MNRAFRTILMIGTTGAEHAAGDPLVITIRRRDSFAVVQMVS
jgi:hypothetical protein